MGARLQPWLIRLAQLTNAQWSAVSVFEDVIDLPTRLASSAGGPLGSGSPARYHIAVAVPTIGSTIAAMITARTPRNRAALAAGAIGTLVAAGITVLLIVTVNVPLLRGSVTGAARRRLIRRWHRVNKARVAVLALTAIALNTVRD